MKYIFLLCFIFLSISCASFSKVQREPSAANDWPTIQPEEAGFSAQKLAEVKTVADAIHSPSGMIIVDGKLIYSWGDTSQKMWIHSCRKSILSALIGIAVEKKQIDLSQSLGDLKIDDIPPMLTEDEKQAKVVDLLESRSGVYHLAAEDTPRMKEKRPPRGSHSPGSFWYYNNWDFNTLGFIYESKTGHSIFDAFSAELAKPLGFQDFQLTDTRYSYDKNLSQYPAYLFNLSTRDFARFGQLYLQNGRWNGTQIVPPKWIELSTMSYSDASPPLGKGYGYLWWTGGADGALFNGITLGSGAIAAEGYGGHYLVIVPSLKMIIVSRADDAWFHQDPKNRNIGMNREGQLIKKILSAVSK